MSIENLTQEFPVISSSSPLTTPHITRRLPSINNNPPTRRPILVKSNKVEYLSIIESSLRLQSCYPATITSWERYKNFKICGVYSVSFVPTGFPLRAAPLTICDRIRKQLPSSTSPSPTSQPSSTRTADRCSQYKEDYGGSPSQRLHRRPRLPRERLRRF